ncbi:MAG: hypothetical protein AB7E32_10695 [Desulfovibrio sp.]
MTPAELIDQVKEKTGSRSYYALAQTLEIPEETIASYRRGRTFPDPYACTKFAIVLGQDPVQLIAEMELQREKNERKKDFWRGFLSRARKGTVAGILALTCFASFLNAGAGRGGLPEPSQAVAVAATVGLMALFLRRRYFL